MKVIAAIVFCCFSFAAFGQSSFLKEAAAKLDRALVAKDTITLKQLLHKDVTYGHSNAWIETKEDIIKDLTSGKLVYHKIESRDTKWKVTNDLASVRSTAAIDFILDGKPGTLQLHVLQMWLKTNKGWQLIARQSTKIENNH